jgi:hypothetical protein
MVCAETNEGLAFDLRGGESLRSQLRITNVGLPNLRWYEKEMIVTQHAVLAMEALLLAQTAGANLLGIVAGVSAAAANVPNTKRINVAGATANEDARGTLPSAQVGEYQPKVRATGLGKRAIPQIGSVTLGARPSTLRSESAHTLWSALENGSPPTSADITSGDQALDGTSETGGPSGAVRRLWIERPNSEHLLAYAITGNLNPIENNDTAVEIAEVWKKRFIAFFMLASLVAAIVAFFLLEVHLVVEIWCICFRHRRRPRSRPTAIRHRGSPRRPGHGQRRWAA